MNAYGAEKEVLLRASSLYYKTTQHNINTNSILNRKKNQYDIFLKKCLYFGHTHFKVYYSK